MDTNQNICDTAWAAMRGEVNVYDDTPGMCLATVRQVLEASVLEPWTLYRDYVQEWVQPEGYDRSNGHWARDCERSLRDLGMAVKGDRARPGDLLFNWRAAWSDRWGAYIGHVAILLDHDLVFENVAPQYRPHSAHRGSLSLTPREYWGEPTTVVRFDPCLKVGR